MQSNRRVQVICPGHGMSRETEQWLVRTYGEVPVYKLHLHVTRFDKIEQEVLEWIDKLKDIGCDLTERTHTIIIPPGSCQVSFVLPTIWYGVTSTLPSMLNLIFRGPERGLVPSPELPIVQLTEIRNRLRLRKRPSVMESGTKQVLRPSSTPLQRPVKAPANSWGSDSAPEVVTIVEELPVTF